MTLSSLLLEAFCDIVLSVGDMFLWGFFPKISTKGFYQSIDGPNKQVFMWPIKKLHLLDLLSWFISWSHKLLQCFTKGIDFGQRRCVVFLMCILFYMLSS